jgi:quinol-cytochrome oxidoreductase complex cytochrome b subunit
VVAIGMGLVFAGYAVGIWGYCLVVGYDVPFAAVFGSTWSSAASFQQAAKTPTVKTA